MVLKSYTDSSFADDASDKFKSTAGMLIMLNGYSIQWKTKKLKWVCSSTTQAEFLALHYTALETVSMGHAIEEIYGKKVFPVRILSDSKSAISVAKGQAPADSTKFLGSKFYQVQQMVECGWIEIEFVRSRIIWQMVLQSNCRPECLRNLASRHFMEMQGMTNTGEC